MISYQIILFENNLKNLLSKFIFMYLFLINELFFTRQLRIKKKNVISRSNREIA